MHIQSFLQIEANSRTTHSMFTKIALVQFQIHYSNISTFEGNPVDSTGVEGNLPLKKTP